jgi:hypothetical protein
MTTIQNNLLPLNILKLKTMKNLFLFLSILTFIFFMTSCGGEEPTDEMIDEVEEFVDDSNAEETAADTSSTGVYQEEVADEETSLQDAMQGSDNETEAEEGGRSFCDCVKRNKELTDIMMADNTSDADFDKAMEELEEMKTNDCKIMFPDQSNIEEKKAHERKVKRCLSK